MKPKQISTAQKAFGVYQGYLPEYKDVPEEFKSGSNKWLKLVNTMMFKGTENLQLKPKDGINPQEAFDHISACMTSWGPKHEHKEAGCAYMFSIWFDDIIST